MQGISLSVHIPFDQNENIFWKISTKLNKNNNTPTILNNYVKFKDSEKKT